jgi:hypothetical protein
VVKKGAQSGPIGKIHHKLEVEQWERVALTRDVMVFLRGNMEL